MKKITSFIIVLFLAMVAVFAVPKKFCDKVYDDEVLTCWLNDTEYPVWTSNLSLEEQLEDLDYIIQQLPRNYTYRRSNVVVFECFNYLLNLIEQSKYGD